MYRLFGYDVATQKELTLRGVDEEREVFSEHEVTRGPFVG